MIKNFKATDRHLKYTKTLKSFYLFSFADYYDPQNVEFGALRVFNDDTVDAEAGFDDHAHNNMEIVTIVLEGTITHKDSMGNNRKISAGEVQRMSAGSLVIHSELNLEKKPVHFYQIWFYPRTRDVKPSYEQKNFADLLIKNKLIPLASGQNKTGALFMDSDATIYRGLFEKNFKIKFPMLDGRGYFIYVKTGRIRANSEIASVFEQLRITEEKELEIEALDQTDLIIIDVPV